eukprot:c12256_g3_i1 orf=1-354(-)
MLCILLLVLMMLDLCQAHEGQLEKMSYCQELEPSPWLAQFVDPLPPFPASINLSSSSPRLTLGAFKIKQASNFPPPRPLAPWHTHALECTPAHMHAGLTRSNCNMCVHASANTHTHTH